MEKVVKGITATHAVCHVCWYFFWGVGCSFSNQQAI